MNARKMTIYSAVLVAGLGVCGCNNSPEKTAPAVELSSDFERRDGWWCDEHGVPEEMCAQCSSKLAADFKARGDWCDEHDRPDSQCFICHPERESEFAAQYEAKYGEAPPKTRDVEEHSHDPQH